MSDRRYNDRPVPKPRQSLLGASAPRIFGAASRQTDDDMFNQRAVYPVYDEDITGRRNRLFDSKSPLNVQHAHSNSQRLPQDLDVDFYGRGHSSSRRVSERPNSTNSRWSSSQNRRYELSEASQQIPPSSFHTRPSSRSSQRGRYGSSSQNRVPNEVIRGQNRDPKRSQVSEYSGRGQSHHRNYHSRNPRQQERNFDDQSSGETNHSKENQTSEFKIRPIPYGAIDDMVKEEDLDVTKIALRLSTENSGFKLRLKTEMDNGWIKLMLQLMSKLCSANEPSQHLNLVLVALVDCQFEQRAKSFLKVVFSSRTLRNAEHAATQVSNCLHLMRGWLLNIPSTAEQPVEILLPFIKAMVAQHTLGGYENIQTRLAEIDQLLLNCYVQPQTNKPSTSKTSRFGFGHEEEPPEDFRQISVFPTNDDIKARESPFVRTNLIDSAYRSTDHYLDVQFRLLREDFIRPLREGINDFVNPDTGSFGLGKKKRRYQGLKAYDNVAIEFPKLSSKGIHYCIHFDTQRLQNVQWQNSKRLLYGNLVCLSSDDFEDHFLFATVTDRDVDKLKMGFIEVEFLNVEGAPARPDGEENQIQQDKIEGTSLVSLEDMKKTYCMVESEAYFEAYRHVLAGLKETHEIPLGQYIVQCQTQLHPPAYLRSFGRNPTYDFSSVLEETGNRAQKSYPVLDTEMWPGAKDFNLNPSQMQALKSALTNELSIIQGPPGTGKTHVGLKIMKMLLGNKADAKIERVVTRTTFGRDTQAVVPDGPIFVVCFTNHALDQFLEGIAKFHPHRLIRVGGRCKTESLKKYMLSAVRRNCRPELSKTMKKTLWEIRNELDDHVSKMEESEEILKESTQSILSLVCLKDVIPQKQLHQLLNFEAEEEPDDNMLLNWLGVKKKMYSFPEDSYVVEETVNVMASFVILRNFTKSDFIAAANATGSLEEEKVLKWLFANQVQLLQQQQTNLNSDIVFAFLEHLPIPFDPRILMRSGYHLFEVKCAWLVCSFNFGEENAVEELISGWLREKRETEVPDPDAEDNGNNIEEESEYLQDQRMIDMENDNLQFIRPDQKRKKRPTNKKKGKVVAAKHDQVGFIDDSPELEDGFQYQTKEKKRRKQVLMKKMKAELSKMDTMTDEEAAAVWDITYLKTEEKWRLYRYWVNALRKTLRDNLSSHVSEYNRLAKALAEIRSQEDLDTLAKADVVAMTTTGAAKYRDMIYKLPVKVMIVEEAAEVLEAHIVTSMPQSTEHLILIGDHQQLKPSPTVYELALRFNLDTSLFERMVKNGIPCSRLTLQHRMRPRIADLIRPHIYKELDDHESVLKYEHVSGIEKSVFFISHTHEEDNVRDTTSKANQYEANFIVCLCKYLLQQGYLPDQITILTAYVGQLFAFKRILANKLRNKKVRVTAVDNFQGEENDIILLSLVRSNAEDKIGFLSIENRVCVALSRAKKGLYCIGNFEMLKRKNDLWRKILKGLKEDDMVGEALPLQCRNHPDRKEKVKNEKDFQKFPEGGCGQPCRSRLDCGHVCTRLCHPDDEEHKRFTCMKICEKTCPNDPRHKMMIPCSSKPLCKELVNKVLPDCGHFQEVLCHKDPKTVTCQNPCLELLPCGHSCKDVCGKKCPTYCKTPVKVLRACGHTSEVPCSDSKNISVRNCKEKCNEVLKCGHICKGNCGQCKQGRLHAGCSNTKCGRVLSCGHICEEKCSAVCPPCMKKCETSCPHSNCKKICYVPCQLCKERCTWKCQHYKCSKLCSEPCDRPRCDEPCLKKLKCGHKCIGLCGEPCPKLCRVCNKKEVTEIFFGDEDEEDARFVQLECGHIFTYENLDTWMEQETMSEGSEIDIKLKECPRCKTVIRRSKRYGKIVNKQLMLINEVRKKIAGDPEEVKSSKEELKDLLENDSRIANYFSSKAKELEKALISAQSLPALSVIEMRYDCLADFCSIKEIMKNLPNGFDQDLTTTMNQVVEWLFIKRSYFSEQEIEDLHLERQRCKDGLKLAQLEDKIAKANDPHVPYVNQCLSRLRIHVFGDFVPYNQKKQEKVKKYFERIKSLMPQVIPGLGITENERQMILGAMDLSKGHWYSCKNGHVYCIGECGGAVVEAKCPYCKETIGGTQHRLAEGNQVAGIMDGATQSAWDPNTFHIPEEVLQWRDGI